MTIEEHSVIGGPGSVVAQIIAELPTRDIRFRCLGIPDMFMNIGSQEHLRALCGLTPHAISTMVCDMLASGVE